MSTAIYEHIDPEQRLDTWKSLYKASPTDANFASHVAVSKNTKRKLNKTKAKRMPRESASSIRKKESERVGKAISVAIPWASESKVLSKASAFYRDVPSSYNLYTESMQQIMLHPENAKGITEALLKLADDYGKPENIGHVIILPGVDTRLVSSLSDIIEPSIMTFHKNGELTETDFEMMRGFADSVEDVGLRFSTEGSTELASQKLYEIFPQVSRLRLNMPEMTSKFVTEWIGDSSKQLTHLVIDGGHIPPDDGTNILKELAASRPMIKDTNIAHPFDYLQVSTLIGIAGENYVLNDWMKITKGFYASITMFDKLELQTGHIPHMQTADKHNTPCHIGLVCSRCVGLYAAARTFFLPKYEPMEKNADSRKRLREHKSHIAIVTHLAGPDLSLKRDIMPKFVKPGGDFMNGYYTPQSFMKTCQTYWPTKEYRYWGYD